MQQPLYEAFVTKQIYIQAQAALSEIPNKAKQTKEGDWIVVYDSGCTMSMTPRRDVFLSELIPFSVAVRGIEGLGISSTHIGYTVLGPMLLVPEINVSLVSGNRIAHGEHTKVEADPPDYEVTNHAMAVTVRFRGGAFSSPKAILTKDEWSEQAEDGGGLILDRNDVVQREVKNFQRYNLQEAELDVLTTLVTEPKPEVTGRVADAELPPEQMKYAKLIHEVHKKLNHVPYEKLKKITEQGMVSHLGLREAFIKVAASKMPRCIVCQTEGATSQHR